MSAIDTSTWQETRFDIKPVGNKGLVVFEYAITQEDYASGYEYIIGSTPNAGDEVTFYFLALAGASNEGGGVITDSSMELFNVNFIHELPYTYNNGIIAGAGMKVTTFYVTLLDNKINPGIISFARDKMEGSAYVSNKDTVEKSFNYTSYDHLISATTGT